MSTMQNKKERSRGRYLKAAGCWIRPKISKVVTAMSVTKSMRHECFSPDIIYARDMVVQLSTHPLDTDQVMYYEVSSFPTSLCAKTGKLEYA